MGAFSQITSKSQTNSGYYDALGAVSETYTANGLNQLLKTGGTQMTYDGRGNMTNDGGTAYTYDVYNHLKTANNGAGTYTYDPEGRLYREQGTPIGGGTAIDSRFLYDGADIIAEYNSSGTIIARYVHGPGVDEPIVWYNGASMSSSTRRYMSADERGSIIMVTNNSGGYVARNKYDDYGDPSSTNSTRFQYTGQIYLKTAGLYHYKARAYHPGIGRFMQTDPIGYGDGLHMYAYVGGDPVNGRDPSGLFQNFFPEEEIDDVMVVDCGGSGCGRGGYSRSSDDQFDAWWDAQEAFRPDVPEPTHQEGQSQRQQNGERTSRKEACAGKTGAAIRICSREHPLSLEEKCEAMAETMRIFTYVGGAAWGISTEEGWRTTVVRGASKLALRASLVVSGAVTVVGVATQMEYDQLNCAER
ncbi:RHS repeat-associated core domain-containing protein [Parvularcula sp. LCG005]|uniref:RHS repeat-associated core domain-containing protein n=1 Tax=Parvularcula sp. LCG005 TaxID=3078805 RepID=UPI002941C593|nr:RHS repeat-associated core domain-containing protein [Parvularcula sp. LCG005]WOI53022.1 RHS repeat-associated core domain-containing protein [Parvularcula sp. LCG005]